MASNEGGAPEPIVFVVSRPLAVLYVGFDPWAALATANKAMDGELPVDALSIELWRNGQRLGKWVRVHGTKEYQRLMADEFWPDNGKTPVGPRLAQPAILPPDPSTYWLECAEYFMNLAWKGCLSES